MEEELYKTLGDAKSRELIGRYDTLWKTLGLSKSRKSTQVLGAVVEGIARDFIREFLPPGFGLKSGLVFDADTKTMSPQIDAIIYNGAPLLEFTDVVVVEKEQVKAIFEIKSWINTPAIFGEKSGGSRDLAPAYTKRKPFLPSGARYILFTFELYSKSTDTEVLKRFRKICDSYAVAMREEPKIERQKGKEHWVYNFDNSVSDSIEWLRNLS